MSDDKAVWLVCRFTGTTNHLARDDVSGDFLFNLEEERATKLVAEWVKYDPDQIYDKLPYRVGQLKLVLDQHHLDLS